MKLNIEHVEYHRNGISGVGFYSVSFNYKDDGRRRNMIAVVFDYDEYPAGYTGFYNPRTAVLDREQLVPEGESGGPFGFGEGSIPCFRGDKFDHQLREAIRDALIANEVKSGMFTREEAVAHHAWRASRGAREAT